MDPFATLGMPRRFDLDAAELERRYRELQRALHPDRHVAASASQRRLSLSKAIEVNEAYRTLRDELARAQALLMLLDRPGGHEAGGDAAGPADPELLMEMMELREGLGEAKAARDLPRVRRMAADVQALWSDARATIASGFAAGDAQGLARVRAGLGRMKYYKRFLDEVAVIEDEYE